MLLLGNNRGDDAVFVRREREREKCAHTIIMGQTSIINISVKRNKM